MVTQDLARPTLSTATVECRELVDLAAILDPKVHTAIWRRPIDKGIAALVARDDCVFGPHSRFVGGFAGMDSGDIADLVPAAARSGDPGGTAAVVADISALCEMFAELTSAEDVMVSLESPDEATCPRFHVDRIGIRMLVTYLGPGTEWLSHEQVDRKYLGRAGEGLSDQENGVMLPGAEVQQVSPFDVVLLKGEAWPGAEGFGAVHRSPDPAGQRRAVLRVDMLSQNVVDSEEVSS